MIEVKLAGHEFYYALSDVLRLIIGIPTEKREDAVIVCDTEEYDVKIESILREDVVTTRIISYKGPNEGQNKEKIRANMTANDIKNLKPLEVKREIKRQLYIILSFITGDEFAWGCLTGIRPTLVANEVNNPEILISEYLVREDKARLAVQTGKFEQRILSEIPNDELNVYIGVPFCPTRCEYCSFVAQDIMHHMGKLESYALALIEEMKIVFGKIDKKVASVYWGGGTPTVFDDLLFEKVLEKIKENINFDKDTEFTIEAGRPDTITPYKLEVMQKAGVNRICINPQTMNDQTLQKLNRKHTVEDIIETYYVARQKGIGIINMDLIAGLKYEDESELINSLKAVMALEPENITIHTLYKKKNAKMSRDDIITRHKDNFKLDMAVKEAYNLLEGNGYNPYYMYRQKDTGHGLENVGFCKGDTYCKYNVAMMTDSRNVLSIGAGAMSKKIMSFDEGGKSRVERFPTVKDSLLYIKNVEDIANRKVDFFKC